MGKQKKMLAGAFTLGLFLLSWLLIVPNVSATPWWEAGAGLVVDYAFWNGTNGTDYSGNNLNLEMVNTPINTSGMADGGGGTYLNQGDGWRRTTDDNEMDTAEFAYSYWLKCNDTELGAGQYALVFSKGKSQSSDTWEFVIQDNGDATEIYGLHGDGGFWIWEEGSYDICDNAWTHVVLQKEGADNKLYIDNSLRTPDNENVRDRVANPGVFSIGITPDGTTGRTADVNFSGSIARYKLFNRSLTVDERTYLYNLTCPPGGCSTYYGLGGGFTSSHNITYPFRSPIPPPGLTVSNLTISTFVDSSGPTNLSYFFNSSFYINRTAGNGTVNMSFDNLSEGTWNLEVRMFDNQGVHSDTLNGILINRTWIHLHEPTQNEEISVSDISFNWTCAGVPGAAVILGSWLNINGSIYQNTSTVTLNNPYTQIVSVITLGTYSWNASCKFSKYSFGQYNETSTSSNFTRVTFPVNISIINEETLFPLTDPIRVKIKNQNFSTVLENVSCTGSCVLNVVNLVSGIRIYYIEATWPDSSPTWVRQIQITINYSEIENISTTLYMPDNDTTATIYSNSMILDDPSNEFTTGLLRVERHLNNTIKTIHFTNWDIELKAQTYLIGGANYIISVVNADRTITRVIGPYVPIDGGAKVLTILTIDYTPKFNLAYHDVGWNFSVTDTNIRITYNDTKSQTNNVSVWIYNGTNTSDILYHASATTALASFTYLPGNINLTYLVKIEINHALYGFLTESRGIGFDDIDRLGNIDLADIFKQIFTLCVLGLVAFGFSARFSKICGPVLLLLAIFFDYVNWWPISIQIRSLMVIIILLARWRE